MHLKVCMHIVSIAARNVVEKDISRPLVTLFRACVVLSAAIREGMLLLLLQSDN